GLESRPCNGRSDEFGASAGSESHLILPPETSLTLAAECRATLAVKPYAQAADGLLMKFRDGVNLFVQADHRLRLEIASGDVVQTLITQQALHTDRWQYVSVTVENSTATLNTGSESVILNNVPVPDRSTGAAALEIGRGYRGLMSDFTLVSLDESSQPLVTFENGALSQDVTVGADGKTTIKI